MNGLKLLGIVLPLLLGAAWAAEDAVGAERKAGPQKKQTYLLFGGNYYSSPDGSTLGRTFGPAIGVGYGFSDRWSAELLYSRFELEFETPELSGHDKTNLIWLDFVGKFGGSRAWQPFGLAGIGRTMSKRQALDDFDDTQLNAGVGVYGALSDTFSLRGDIRAVYSIEEKGLEPFAFLGLTVSLGGAKTAAAPLDSDGDGVADSRDRCPATPTGASVDASGCELDGDADGVVDRLDRCPDTPAGASVDARGCALDSDGDGVPDYMDDCPDSSAGSKVDARGCYIELTEQVTIDLNLEFDTNSATLREDQRPEVQRAVDFLRQYPTATAVIEGHSDSDGAAAYNQSLSEKRAAAVRDYLIASAGIDAARLSSVGYGESRPIADNGTSEGKQLNRRVAVVISGTETVRQ